MKTIKSMRNISTRRISVKPARGVPEKPTRVVPAKLARGVPVKPARGVPAKPARGVPAKPAREVLSRPTRGVSVRGVSIEPKRKVSAESAKGASAENVLRTDMGATSHVNIYKDIVIKRVIKYHSYNTFEREVYWLTYLNGKGYNWIPKLIKNNVTEKTITMQYCGEKLTSLNAPEDWREQVNKILSDLKNENIKHNDIKNTELLVKDNHITLIDYGWASLGDDWSCGGKFSPKAKPSHGFFDHTAVERIEKKLI
jgi:predicted Ser/Thr protein kinase